MAEASEQVYRLACMELRGGNEQAAYSAELPGLRGWVSCNPLRPASRGGDLYYLSACSREYGARGAGGRRRSRGSGQRGRRPLHDALRQHVDHWDQSALIRS